MKKIVALMLAFLMMMSAGAIAESLLGGWTVAEDNEVTEELRTVFDKAVEKLLGVGYEPIAYLGSQTVAGLNHCFLCKATVIYPDAKPTYALVYIHADPEGNAEVLNIAELDIAELAAPAVQE